MFQCSLRKIPASGFENISKTVLKYLKTVLNSSQTSTQCRIRAKKMVHIPLKKLLGEICYINTFQTLMASYPLQARHCCHYSDTFQSFTINCKSKNSSQSFVTTFHWKLRRSWRRGEEILVILFLGYWFCYDCMQITGWFSPLFQKNKNFSS